MYRVDDSGGNPQDKPQTAGLVQCDIATITSYYKYCLLPFLVVFSTIRWISLYLIYYPHEINILLLLLLLLSL